MRFSNTTNHGRCVRRRWPWSLVAWRTAVTAWATLPPTTVASPGAIATTMSQCIGRARPTSARRAARLGSGLRLRSAQTMSPGAGAWSAASCARKGARGPQRSLARTRASTYSQWAAAGGKSAASTPVARSTKDRNAADQGWQPHSADRPPDASSPGVQAVGVPRVKARRLRAISASQPTADQ